MYSRWYEISLIKSLIFSLQTQCLTTRFVHTRFRQSGWIGTFAVAQKLNFSFLSTQSGRVEMAKVQTKDKTEFPVRCHFNVNKDTFWIVNEELEYTYNSTIGTLSTTYDWCWCRCDRRCYCCWYQTTVYQLTISAWVIQHKWI